MPNPIASRTSAPAQLNEVATQKPKVDPQPVKADKGKGKEKQVNVNVNANAGDAASAGGEWVDEPSVKSTKKKSKARKNVAEPRPEHVLLTAFGGKKVWHDLPTPAEGQQPSAATEQGPAFRKLPQDGSVTNKAQPKDGEGADQAMSIALSKFKKVWFDKEVDPKEKPEEIAQDDTHPKRRYYRINQIPSISRIKNPPLRLTEEEQAQAKENRIKSAATREKRKDEINKQRAEALKAELSDNDGNYLENQVTHLPKWPPRLNPSQLDWICHSTIAWSLGNGFCLIPPGYEAVPMVTHAPLSLLPTPFPRRLYQLAKTLQPILNSLYMRIALDDAFLRDVFEGSVNHVDPWQNLLYYYYHQVKRFPASRRALGIFRSDYLLHEPEEGGPLELKQVEFNTIASSFGGLSEKANHLHRHLNVSSRGYFGTHPLLLDEKNFDIPESASAIAASLADSWLHYTNEVGRKNPIVLFVVQDGERNVFDQKAIEWVLLHQYRIRSERRTFKQLASTHMGCGVRREDETLYIMTPTRDDQRDLEVAVVYFRAGYTPDEYEEPVIDEKKTTSAEHVKHINFRIRVLFEKSRAICCPTFALQLAGAKKVQQVLTEPGVLESFLFDADRPDTGFGEGRGWLDESWADVIRSTWVDMWPLDRSELGTEAIKLAMSEPERFVMKPQREGGGNNVYRTDIPPLLEKLKESGLVNGRVPWERYVLMELIQPPKGVYNWLMKGDDAMRRVEVVSELGVYGTMSYGHLGRIRNRRAGILLRTKGADSDEGGVAIGISSIDSPLLIDEDYVEPSPPPVDDESDDTGSDFTDEVQNWYVYSEDEDENEEEAKQKDDKQVAAQKKKAAGDGSGAGEQEWHDDDCNCKTCKKDLQDDAQFDWPSSVPAAP